MKEDDDMSTTIEPPVKSPRDPRAKAAPACANF